MNMLRTIAQIIATTLGFLFAGVLGAVILSSVVIIYVMQLKGDDQPIGVEQSAIGVLALMMGAVGFLAGLLVAWYLWARWSGPSHGSAIEAAR
jgi:hypothetical protein